MRYLSIVILASLLVNMEAADWKSLGKDLGAAQAAKDQASVNRLAQEIISALGDKAGQPEEAAEFVMPDQDIKPLKAEQVPGLFALALSQIQDKAWWKNVKTGSECQAPLRAVASVVEGCLLAKAAGCEQPETLMAEARAAADFLLAAQKEAGRDCFPFPGWRGKKGRLGALADKFLAKAEAEGKVDQVMKNGWIMDDLGGGDLYFDNGLAGSAVLSFYEATKEDKYLQSARQAGEWAMKRPAVMNWNYNSFTVQLLANLHRVTGEVRFLDAAKETCRLGILPGQLTSGPNVGRWADPHNAKLVYHFIILRGITCLLLQLPESDPEYKVLQSSLEAGLNAWNGVIIEQGGSSPDITLEVYTRLMEAKSKLVGLIESTRTAEAAAMISRVVVEEFKMEHPTVSPASWGRHLKFVAGK